jgi:glycosyltransferase involved in cell wall biosynthesis
MFTAGVRDFKLLFPTIDICPDSNFVSLFDNNPYISWNLIEEWEDQKAGRADSGVEYYRVGYPNINNSNNSSSHFAQGFLWDMIAIANAHKPLPSRAFPDQDMTIGEFASTYANGEVGDPPLFKEKGPDEKRPTDSPYGDDFSYFEALQKEYKHFCKTYTRLRGDIHLSKNELKHNLLKEAYGVDNYWVVAPGGKRDCTAKMWDWRRFQDVVDHFAGQIQFVTIGKSDHLVTRMDGVIDLTDKFNEDIRGLVPLCYHSNGGVGGVTFLLHMMGALPNQLGHYSKPFVCFVGGREPLTFTTYNQVHSLHTSGIYSCCQTGGCWASRVEPLMKDPKLNKNLCAKPVKVDGRMIQECAHQVTSSDVIRLFERIYAGDIYKSINSVTRPIKIAVKGMEVKKKMFCKKTGCSEEAVEGGDCCEKHKPKVKKKKTKKITAESNRNEFYETINKAGTVSALKPLPEPKKEINVLASLSSEGGGEQSVLKIVDLLRADKWKVNLIPWANVSSKLNKRFSPDYTEHKYIGDIDDSPRPDFEALAATIKRNTPLLFYSNDQIWDFCKYSQPLIEVCSQLVVCINWANGDLPRWHWLSKSGKLRAVIFHCEEKRAEFDRDAFGFTNTARVVLFGAIELEKFLQVQPLPREKKEPLRVLKHCVADARKYVTSETQPGGDKKHVWQEHFWKDTDMDLYSKLLKKFGKKIVYEFMAAPEEVREYFKDEERMRFYKWNDAPVEKFLARGHVYFYRTSNHWRDNYPRVVAEALAAGLPVLGEPRDGTKDRIQHGDTGFYCCHYDELELHLGTLLRKEGLRQAMGLEAKRWAERNLDPKAWVSVLSELLL